MSRVGDLVRKGKKYQAGTKIKFRNNKGGSLGIKSIRHSGNPKLYKVGSRVKLRGKLA